MIGWKPTTNNGPLMRPGTLGVLEGMPPQFQALLKGQSSAFKIQALTAYKTLTGQGALQPSDFNLVDFMYKASALMRDRPGGKAFMASLLAAAKGKIGDADLAWTETGLSAQEATAALRKQGAEMAAQRLESDRRAFSAAVSREATAQDMRRQQSIRRSQQDELNLKATLADLRTHIGLS